ncbi:uncharacterized protein LOC127462016 [Manacus candei]|uniref:uncharacterized protein LOC127462016 n=1 Tax=Manacus candei TaxID=415023 RepID=UPI0022275DBA|nr:uncharacterized protein LOC127462016 [Manacus candei]
MESIWATIEKIWATMGDSWAVVEDSWATMEKIWWPRARVGAAPPSPLPAAVPERGGQGGPRAPGRRQRQRRGEEEAARGEAKAFGAGRGARSRGEAGHGPGALPAGPGGVSVRSTTAHAPRARDQFGERKTLSLHPLRPPETATREKRAGARRRVPRLTSNTAQSRFRPARQEPSCARLQTPLEAGTPWGALEILPKGLLTSLGSLREQTGTSCDQLKASQSGVPLAVERRGADERLKPLKKPEPHPDGRHSSSGQAKSIPGAHVYQANPGTGSRPTCGSGIRQAGGNGAREWDAMSAPPSPGVPRVGGPGSRATRSPVWWEMGAAGALH